MGSFKLSINVEPRDIPFLDDAHKRDCADAINASVDGTLKYTLVMSGAVMALFAAYSFFGFTWMLRMHSLLQKASAIVPLTAIVIFMFEFISGTMKKWALIVQTILHVVMVFASVTTTPTLVVLPFAAYGTILHIKLITLLPWYDAISAQPGYPDFTPLPEKKQSVSDKKDKDAEPQENGEKSEDTKKHEDVKEPEAAEKPTEEKRSGDAEKREDIKGSEVTEKPAEEKRSGDAEKREDIIGSEAAEKPAEENKSGTAEEPAEEKRSGDAEKREDVKGSEVIEKPAEENKSGTPENQADEKKPGTAEEPAEENKSENPEKQTGTNKPSGGSGKKKHKRRKKK